MTRTFFFRLCIAGILLGAAPGGGAAPAAEAPDADKIMQRAYEVYGGDDVYARLRFNFEYEQGKTGAVALVMAYKRYQGKGDAEAKVIMFNEFPPDKKDIGFLGWFYRPEQAMDDDMWLYLPELRQTRRLNHGHGHGGGGDRRMRMGGKAPDDTDEFSVSELDQEVLVPRRPGLDVHRLLGADTLAGKAVFRIESVPKDPQSSSYGKFIASITQQEMLPVQIDYYDREMTLAKTQTFSWKKFGDAWVWDRISAVNHLNGNRTVLEQSDTRVNSGLPDELFSKRMLDQGAETFMQRVGRYGK